MALGVLNYAALNQNAERMWLQGDAAARRCRHCADTFLHSFPVTNESYRGYLLLDNSGAGMQT